MSTKDNGGSAFPEIFTDIRGERGDYHPDTYSAGGMSLRDYFAAKAIGPLIRITAPTGTVFGPDGDGEKNCLLYANCAYALADAMLKVRQS